MPFFINVPNEKISIKQLLTHTSGLVRCPIPREIADTGSEKVAEYILAYPLAYAPGAVHNFGQWLILKKFVTQSSKTKKYIPKKYMIWQNKVVRDIIMVLYAKCDYRRFEHQDLNRFYTWK